MEQKHQTLLEQLLRPTTQMATHGSTLWKQADDLLQSGDSDTEQPNTEQVPWGYGGGYDEEGAGGVGDDNDEDEYEYEDENGGESENNCASNLKNHCNQVIQNSPVQKGIWIIGDVTEIMINMKMQMRWGMKMRALMKRVRVRMRVRMRVSTRMSTIVEAS